MELGKYGLWFFLDAMPAKETLEFARTGEKLGYSALWIPEAVGRHPFAHAGYLLAGTDKLILATGIANIYARDPLTMAAGARSLAEQSGGRFILGIGVSHKHLVSGLRGHDYSKPYSYMAEYLPKMKQSMYKAAVPKEEPPILLAALHPKMLQLAAAQADGTHTYFTTPDHTAKFRAAIGEKPWICAAQAVILESDPVKARTAARNYMQIYLRAPNYMNSVKNAGFTDADFANNGSDRLVDSIVAWGSADQIRGRIEAHLKAGANHVCLIPLRVDGKPVPDTKAVEALAPR